ncbi:MAG: molybdenum cofactor biosynthesis protein MoaE [Proteobacteria bacterium]|nr:molybdenum cofactor biosynthesis protein MoaE [Pseudomonadota bacterium]
MFEIVDRKIDFESIVAKVTTPSAGAISTFIGTTRNHTGDQQVDYLFYEAYHSMAIELMGTIEEQIRSKYEIEKIAITHRIGKVDVGQASVVIAVSAGHRQPAIQACQYAIDTLKKIVPIWKKEFMKDGEQKWIANRG